jgi:hypothetical protein
MIKEELLPWLFLQQALQICNKWASFLHKIKNFFYLP